MRQMIYHLVGHEILKKTVYVVCHFNVYSRVNGEIVRKIAKNGISNCKFMKQMIYHLEGQKILNKTLYFLSATIFRY